MSLEKQALILKFEEIGGKQQQEGKSKKDQVTEEMFWDIYLGIRPESRLRVMEDKISTETSERGKLIGYYRIPVWFSFS